MRMHYASSVGAIESSSSGDFLKDHHPGRSRYSQSSRPACYSAAVAMGAVFYGVPEAPTGKEKQAEFPDTPA